jgi:MYND finger
MHEILLMRNMHDTGGSDIPILITSWDEDATSRAMEYWSELSKGKWNDSERFSKCKYPKTTLLHRSPIMSNTVSECVNKKCRRSLPCFPQADLLVRSLLSDPEVGYVPPFIIIVPHQGVGCPRVRALFTQPSHAPPSELTQSWPQTCGQRGCQETDCGSFDFKACRSLSEGSTPVRKSPFPGKRVACNLWGCEVLHKPEEGSTLMRCKRCKEAFYCSSEHQVAAFY